MPEPINGYYTTSTFQSMDGSNFTTSGFDVKFPYGLSTYAGLGTNFTGGNVGVFDLKECNKYGNSIVGQDVRIRTKFDENLSTTQLRVSPLTVNVPLNDKTSVYVNPHYVGQYDYKAKTWKNGAGIFAGDTQKLGKGMSISFEGQRYNLQDVSDNNGGNWSINAIFSVKLQ